MQRLRLVLKWIATHRLVTAAILLLAAAAGLNVLAFGHARAMTTFVARGSTTARPERLGPIQKLGTLCFGVTVGRPRNVRTPADVGLAYSVRRVTTRDGIDLETWLVPHEDHRGIVVLLHGYAASKHTLLDAAQEFHEFGFSTLLVDFRGSGGSQGNSTSLGFHEANDVAATLTEARRLSGGKPVILYGRSMGAVAGLRAVHVQGVRPDRLLLEAPFSDLLVTTRRRFELLGVPSWPSAELLLFWGGVQQRMDPFDHNPAEYAVSVACPTLILLGGADQRVSVDDGREILDKIPAPDKSLTLFEGVGHAPFLAACPESWRAAVSAFLAGD